MWGRGSKEGRRGGRGGEGEVKGERVCVEGGMRDVLPYLRGRRERGVRVMERGGG